MYVFSCFIEDTNIDFIEYFNTKNEALYYVKDCLRFMKEHRIKYSRIAIYDRDKPCIDYICDDIIIGMFSPNE
jgi:hypothetical protein